MSDQKFNHGEKQPLTSALIGWLVSWLGLAFAIPLVQSTGLTPLIPWSQILIACTLVVVGTRLQQKSRWWEYVLEVAAVCLFMFALSYRVEMGYIPPPPPNAGP